MKHNFRGWKTVFNFTFRQATKGAGFKFVTALVTFLIIGAFILVNVLAAKPEKTEEIQVSPVKSVYVLDNSGFKPTDYKVINPQLSGEQFKNTEFKTAANVSREDVIKTASSDSPQAIAVIITKNGAAYDIEAVIPQESTITKSQANTLLGQITTAFETNKMLQAGLTEDQLTAVFKPVVTSYSDIGENTSEIAKVIKMVAPMIFGFMLYFMLLLYGQTISKSVSTEKTSKLMETLLTSVHPYALITGKVLAITSMALIQFVTWIIAVFVGLYGGNAAAHAVYPTYENSVISVINFLKDNIGQTAMTLPAVVLAVIVFCVGFLFYCVIAGLAGSLVSKPEDVAATQSVFVFPVLISFLVCYMAPAMGNEAVIKFTRYIPFTAPFSVPVDLITGTIGLAEGIIALLLLSVFTLLIIILSARIYKGVLLYNGQKLSMKMAFNVLKTNK